MTNENDTDKPQIEIAGDADWKDKVKAEDAKLDAEAKAESEEAEAASDSTAESDQERHMDIDQLPPASFSMMVQMFATQAMVALGVIPSPEGKQIQQLPLAKHFIDLMSVLDEKCKGNLSSDEEKLLEQSLHELRMAYVQLSSAAK